MVKKRLFSGALPATQFILEIGASLYRSGFSARGIEKHGPRIAELFRKLGIPEDKIALWTPVVWTHLVEFAPFFTPGRQNELLKTARAHVAAPTDQMQRAAARAVLMIQLYLGVFTEYDNPEFIASLTPCISGLLLHFKDNPGTEELLQRIELGNTSQVTFTMKMFRHVIEAVVAVLTNRPIPPPPEPRLELSS